MNRYFLSLIAIAAACTSEGTSDVTLETTTCDGTPSAFIDATDLRVTPFAAGLDPLTLQTRTSVNSGALAIPTIEVGLSPIFVFEALGRNDLLLARATLGPFADTGEAETLTANATLRAVDRFTPASGVGHPQTCVGLAFARAGHTATLLLDGRVYLAGGFFDEGVDRTFLRSAEIYDPKTGTVTAAADLGTARAFHTATLTESGLVVVAGGETAAGALAQIEVYDPATNTYRVQEQKRPRSRHGAASLGASRVLLVGGTGRNGITDATTEVYDAARNETVDGPSLPHALSNVGIARSGNDVFVVGGWDGADVVQEATMFKAAGAVTIDPTRSWTVTGASRGGTLIELGEGRFLLAGGRDAASEPVATTLLLDPATKVSRAGPRLSAKRADAGVVLLRDGTVAVIGGQTSAAPEESTLASAEILYPSGAAPTGYLGRATDGALRKARQLATTTVLGDGTVLVAGGARRDAIGVVPVGSLEIFQPKYAISVESPWK